MKARVAMIVVVVAIAVVALVMMRKPAEEGPSSPAVPPENVEPVAVASTPEEAVILYVEALYRGDCEFAYGQLSSASRQAHPYEEFLERAVEGAAPQFDLGEAEVGAEKDGRVIVTVPLVEDPAAAGFTTLREDGGWKVVFIGGEPWFPYPEGDPEEISTP